jgi:hypothetical protein
LPREVLRAPDCIASNSARDVTRAVFGRRCPRTAGTTGSTCGLPTRPGACAPWLGGASGRLVRPCYSCDGESRASGCAELSWADMCASLRASCRSRALRAADERRGVNQSGTAKSRDFPADLPRLATALSHNCPTPVAKPSRAKKNPKSFPAALSLVLIDFSTFATTVLLTPNICRSLAPLLGAGRGSFSLASEQLREGEAAMIVETREFNVIQTGGRSA